MQSNKDTQPSTSAIEVPIMDQELFSQKIGISKDTVRGMVATQQLPTVKIGRRRFVNLAELNRRCLKESTPSNA
jgi:hypothetical protein